MKTTTSFTGLKQLLKVCLLVVMSVSFVSGTAWAQKRISEDERKDLQIQVKEGLLEYKQETDNAPYDFEKMRPGLVQTIHEFYDERTASPDEIEVFMNGYDQMAKQSADLDEAGKEKAIYAFLNDVINKINQKPISYRTEGESCNDWSCAKGLSCAPVPQQKAGPARHKRSCETVQSRCESNSDCCTGYCHEDYKSKQKTCRPQMKCYKPVALGDSCNESPVCEEGSCLPYNQATSTVLACELTGNSCSSDGDCCSGLCQSGSCQKNFVCKDCVAQGQKAQRGRNCCEGLMKNESGRCVIDRPPFVDSSRSEQNEWSLLVNEIVSLIIPQAKAQSSVGAARNAIKNAGDSELWKNDGVLRETKSDGQKRRESMDLESKAQAANKASLLGFELRPRSDFESCDINFKNDFFHGLKEKDAYDYQLTLLGFEYVALGSGVEDLWTVDMPSSESMSIHRTLKNIAQESRETRRKIFEKVAEKEKQVKCLCYDKNGYENLDEDKKGFYKEECPELYGAYLENKRRAEELGQEDIELGDASGIKYKMMYTKWVQATKELEADVFMVNSNVERKLRDVGRWMATNDWNETQIRNIDLFNFTVKNPSGRVMIGSAVTAGLLSAGVIAITGGFAAGATLSAWAAVGIISATAATGGVGGWLMSSLKGAWTSHAPIVQDEFVPGRENYKCGKKDRCADYTRILRQPYNKVCNKHISANACIKSFLTYEEDDKTRYLIDPWVPLDVEENLVIRDTREYAGLLETGFLKARNHLKGRSPGGKQSDSYLERTFIDEVSAGFFSPKLKGQEEVYKVTQRIKSEVMLKAKKYAIDEAFFLEEEEQNLELFSRYVWDYHYVFPRKTLDDAIAYPPPGLVDYVELVSLAASNASENNLDTQRSLAQVHNLVLEDLKQTIEGFGQGVALDGYFEAADLDREALSSRESDEGSRISGQGLDFSFDPETFNSGDAREFSDQANAGIIDGGSLEGESEEFQNAVASHRRIKEEREQAMQDYVERMGDSERGKKMLEAQKELTKSFFSPVGIGGGANSSGPALDERSRSDLARTSDEAQKEVQQGSGVDFSGTAGSYDTDFGSSSSRSARTSSRGGRSSGGNGVSDENAQRMKDVIDARDQVGKEAFEKKDGQSLWEIVTNTYIRVYDKLLPRRESAARLEELE